MMGTFSSTRPDCAAENERNPSVQLAQQVLLMNDPDQDHDATNTSSTLLPPPFQILC